MTALTAAVAVCWVGLFLALVASVAQAWTHVRGEPLFAETVDDEFADDEPEPEARPRTCRKPNCDQPEFMAGLCTGHYDLYVDLSYELTRDREFEI